MPFTHVVVHYHRHHADYDAWHVAILPSPHAAPTASYSPSLPHARTSFGSVFRIPRTHLPTTPYILPFQPHSSKSDSSPRPFSPDTPHVFLLQSSPDAHDHPSRFSPIAITATSPHTLSVYYHQCVAHLFPPSPSYRHPAIPILYLLFSYPPHSQLCVTQNHQSLHLSASPPPDAFTITTSSNPQCFTISSEPAVISPATYDIRQFLIAQAAQKPYASKPLPPPQPLSPYPPISDFVQTLIVYFHTFSVPQPERLSVRCVNHHPAPSIAPTSPYHEQNAFAVDLSTLPADVINAGLEIIPVPPFHQSVTWTPSLGYHVILAETFDRLLPAKHVDHTIMYHRFGDCDDWQDWELHLWVEATDNYPAQSLMSRSERPSQNGVLMFHLLAAVFPQGASIHAQPVRMRTMPGNTYTNEYGETCTTESYRDADRRDVVRTWQSGKSGLNVMHFVQGDQSIGFSAPDREELHATRRVRLLYRRFEVDDNKDWDLWTWDHSDPEAHRVPVSSSSSGTWVEFVLDRADYGAAHSLNVFPRYGGDDWTKTDDPVRVWSAEMFKGAGSSVEAALSSAAPVMTSGSREKAKGDGIPTFLIVQNSSVVFRRLEDAKYMLRAFVDGEHSVLVAAPVPFGWILPPGRQRRVSIKDTTVTVHDSNAYDLLEDTMYRRHNVGARNLRPLKVQTLSHTEARLVFSPGEATFHEDFLVENIIVSVPGFERVVLTWRLHDDWDEYYYAGTLGWEYTPEATLFRCFAPTADQVSVVLYSSPSGKAGRTLVPMRRIPNGCWKAIVDCDIKGRYYKLLAEGENKRLFPGVEVIDPYSRCNTSHTGRGLIFGTESTKIHPRPDIKPSETVVYELHIRDATIDVDSGVSEGGKFIGLAERGTSRKTQAQAQDSIKQLTHWEQEKMPGVVGCAAELLDKYSTGLDHIVQMGVNAVQILPVQDFDNDEEDDEAYRWGYMPVHFNSPDGWYASETSTVARVTEFKQLVDAIHKAGLKVIMDVVYNHTAEDSNEYNLEARFSFNGLAPRYYYRTCGNTPVAHNGDGTCGLRKAHEPRCGACYSNGSGCGNEFRSESPMGRKFITDSLKYWATEYMVDGFRFDLIGLIDVDTVAQAAAELKKIDPNIIIYGEPWCGGLTPIRITDKGTQRSKGFGVFNNTFRDAIRGSSFGIEETFLMDGGRLGEVKGGIVGSVDDFCDKPIETINYVECHDNYTLWDHMRFYTRSRDDDISFTEADMRRMDRLAAVIVFTAQGIPFIQIGQEMCRTKFDVENSYESPDEINMIRWETKEKEWSTVLYYRGLILMRRSHPEIFCLETAEEVREAVTFYEDLGLAVPVRCIAFTIKGNPGKLLERLKKEGQESSEAVLEEESLKWTELAVILNPTPSATLFELPGKEKDCVWFQVLDATTSGVRTIQGPRTASVEVPGRSAAIMRRASERETANAQLELRLAAVTDSYCIFHGDDVISRYAVGLESEMTEPERAEHAELKNLRNQFLSKRKLRNSTKSELSVPVTSNSSTPGQKID